MCAFALINARCLFKRTDVIISHLITFALDLFAVTDTWLAEYRSDVDLLDICPNGFSAIQSTRNESSRGGGLTLSYRESFRLNAVSFWFSVSSFELLVMLFQLTSICIRLAVIYRSVLLSLQSAATVYS